MLIVQRNTSAVTAYEFATVASVSGGLITLGVPLTNTYSVPSQSPVTFTNLAGTSASGNTLTNTGCAPGWSCGASSIQSIVSGNGFVEATAAQTNAYLMFGLGVDDAHASYDDIEFAIYMLEGGVLAVYEAGVYRGYVGNYVTGDRLRVAVENGTVTYRKNGALLYRSVLTPSYPLRVDTAFYTGGATLADVTLATGYAAAQVVRVPNFSTLNVNGAGASNVNWSYRAPRRRHVSKLSPCGRVYRLDLRRRLGHRNTWWRRSRRVLHIREQFVQVGRLGFARSGDRNRPGRVWDSPQPRRGRVHLGTRRHDGRRRSLAGTCRTTFSGLPSRMVKWSIERMAACCTSHGAARTYPLHFIGEMHDQSATINNVRLQAASSVTGTIGTALLGVCLRYVLAMLSGWPKALSSTLGPPHGMGRYRRHSRSTAARCPCR